MTTRSLTVDPASTVVISDVQGRTIRSVSVNGTGTVGLIPEATGACFVTVRSSRGVSVDRMLQQR